jgi:glycosyltransferase involved in cell wall biosynthesis
MENPLISVIVPVFNREKILEKTLQSLTNQTFRPFEIILVDNNSEDKSLEICNNFQLNNKDESLIIKVISELKPGANAARNKGFKNSDGDYLYFFDSDDILYPGSLEIMYRNLYKYDFPEILAFPFQIRTPDGKLTRRPKRISKKPESQLFDTVLATHGMIIRRSLFEKSGLWDKSLTRWQDLEFGFRLMLFADKMIWIKGEPLYEVITHEDSISAKSYTDDHYNLNKTIEKIQSTIDNIDDAKLKMKMQKALCFRICSIAAQIKSEGHELLSKAFLEDCMHKLPETGYAKNKYILNLHYKYTGSGYRGFWRIAEKLL